MPRRAEIQALFDVYRDVARAEWIPVARAIMDCLARIRGAHDALARPPRMSRRIGSGAPPTAHW